MTNSPKQPVSEGLFLVVRDWNGTEHLVDVEPGSKISFRWGKPASYCDFTRADGLLQRVLAQTVVAIGFGGGPTVVATYPNGWPVNPTD